MPDALIPNAVGVWGYTPTANSTVKWFVNGSATVRKPGDVVVLRGVAPDGSQVNSTITASDTTVVGVVAAPDPLDLSPQPTTLTYAIGADLPIIVMGPCRINIAGGVVAANDLLGTLSAPAGAAGTVATPTTGQIIAIALEPSTSKDTATNTIRCYVAKM